MVILNSDMTDADNVGLSILLHVRLTDETELLCSNVIVGPYVTWLSRDHFTQFTGNYRRFICLTVEILYLVNGKH